MIPTLSPGRSRVDAWDARAAKSVVPMSRGVAWDTTRHMELVDPSWIVSTCSTLAIGDGPFFFQPFDRMPVRAALVLCGEN